MSPLTVVYGLSDPRTPLIRYIGKTILGCKTRRRLHIQDAKNNSRLAVAGWIRMLLSEGVEPEILVVEECTYENLNDREVFHIAKLRAEGFNLFNRTKGGTGGPTMKGRKFSAEHKQRISAALMDHAVSETSRTKASERMSRMNREGKIGRPFRKGEPPWNKD